MLCILSVKEDISRALLTSFNQFLSKKTQPRSSSVFISNCHTILKLGNECAYYACEFDNCIYSRMNGLAVKVRIHISIRKYNNDHL